MAKQAMNVCPGCSKHCPMGSPRCKYGRKYFEKLAQEKEIPQEIRRHYKWEKLVHQGGLVWQLLWVASRSKKALRKKELTEHELLLALDNDELEQLQQLLEKISATIG